MLKLFYLFLIALYNLKNKPHKPSMMTHIYNPSTQEAEAGESSSRPPGLHRETVSKRNKQTTIPHTHTQVHTTWLSK
jgi:hypothetical protein